MIPAITTKVDVIIPLTDWREHHNWPDYAGWIVEIDYQSYVSKRLAVTNVDQFDLGDDEQDELYADANDSNTIYCIIAIDNSCDDANVDNYVCVVHGPMPIMQVHMAHNYARYAVDYLRNQHFNRVKEIRCDEPKRTTNDSNIVCIKCCEYRRNCRCDTASDIGKVKRKG